MGAVLGVVPSHSPKLSSPGIFDPRRCFFSLGCMVRDATVASKRQVFGRSVSSIIVDPGRVDLGLNLKQNGRYQLLEYSRSEP